MNKFLAILIVLLLSSDLIPGFSLSLCKADAIADARKEGEVVIWTRSWRDPDRVVKPFSEKHPFLKVKMWDGSTDEIVNKMIEEAQVGKYSPDILVIGTRGLTLLKRAGLLQEYNWPSHVQRWKDQPPHRLWLNHAASIRVPTYNTRYISAKEAPKSWEELKDAKWRGKAITSASGGDVPLLFADLWRQGEQQLNWDKALRFWDEVIKMTKPHVMRGFTGPNELHVSGEYSIFLLNSHSWLEYLERGAPVRPVSVGKTVGSPWGIAVPKTIPHPHAAKLFIEYFVSAEGLLKYADANYLAVLDPVAAKKAKGNVQLRESGIEWYSVSDEIMTEDNIRKATRWWATTLGIRRGR